MLAVSLLHRIRKDLKKMGLPIEEVDLVVYKRYSSCYYGNYYSSLITKGRPLIKIYPYANKNRDMYPYDVILDIVIHEMVHHLQFTSEDFVRYENIAHDQDFWKRYAYFIKRAKKKRLIHQEYKGMGEVSI